MSSGPRLFILLVDLQDFMASVGIVLGRFTLSGKSFWICNWNVVERLQLRGNRKVAIV